LSHLVKINNQNISTKSSQTACLTNFEHFCPACDPKVPKKALNEGMNTFCFSPAEKSGTPYPFVPTPLNRLPLYPPIGVTYQGTKPVPTLLDSSDQMGTGIYAENNT
jgi:hypothetical protein